MKTGTELDKCSDKLDLLNPGCITLIEGGPGSGKSTLFKYIVYTNRKNAFVVDAETSVEEQIKRYIALAGFKLFTYKDGAIEMNVDAVCNFNNLILDEGCRLWDARLFRDMKHIVQSARKYPIKLLAFDMPGNLPLQESRESRYPEEFLSQFLKTLRALGGELGVPILVTCFLGNRAAKEVADIAIQIEMEQLSNYDRTMFAKITKFRGDADAILSPLQLEDVINHLTLI